MRRKFILVIGNSFFGQKLVAELQKDQNSMRFLVLDPSGLAWHRVLYVLLLPFADLVWTISGSLDGGMSLKLAAGLKKKIFQLFIGTDVLQTAEVVKKGLVNPNILKVSTLSCNAPWLADEMAQLGFKAPYVRDYVYGFPLNPPPMPEQFSILTYVPQGKEELYGMPWIVSCAKRFPDIPVRIIGMSRTTWTLPANIALLGRVSMENELKNCSVLLRLTTHDGMGHTVIEALGMGRWVIRTNAMAEVALVQSESELISQIQRFYDRFKQGQLGCNLAGYEYVKAEFNREQVIGKLMQRIEQSL